MLLHLPLISPSNLIGYIMKSTTKQTTQRYCEITVIQIIFFNNFKLKKTRLFITFKFISYLDYETKLILYVPSSIMATLH